MTTAVGAGPALAAQVGTGDAGLCTLTFQDRIFTFRTNPNSIWWNYELITHTEETYGGRVVQILGTKLGDLSIKVECGNGGWDYLMMVVDYLRNLLTDQRNGQTAQFAYTSRGWLLSVYAMTIPYGDQVTATTREIELNFKIQQDISGLLSQLSLDVEFANLADGIYTLTSPGQLPHNQYNDPSGIAGNVSTLLTDPENPSGPTYDQSQPINTVDDDVLGNSILGLNFGNDIPGLSEVESLLGGGL